MRSLFNLQETKRIKIAYAMALCALFMFGVSWAVDSNCRGEGRTRQEAINSALRMAVEKELGVRLKSETEVSRGSVEFDRIVSASAGYVKNYTVVAEGKDPLDNLYKVKLFVQIDDYKLKSALEDFLNDPRAQRIFQETKFDKRKVVVVYKPGTQLDLPYDASAVKKVMSQIEDELVDKGFRVYLPDQLMRIRDRSTMLMADDAAAIDIAKEEGGDAVVVVNLDAGKMPTSDGYYIILASLSLKAYDSTTAECFANVSKREKTLARMGVYGEAAGIEHAAIKMAPKCVKLLTEKIVCRFNTNRAKSTALIFTNISIDSQDKIEDLLEDVGWRYRVARQSGRYLELEVFSEADPTSIRRRMREAIRKAQLPLSPIEMSGSRITFEEK